MCVYTHSIFLLRYQDWTYLHGGTTDHGCGLDLFSNSLRVTHLVFQKCKTHRKSLCIVTCGFYVSTPVQDLYLTVSVQCRIVYYTHYMYTRLHTYNIFPLEACLYVIVIARSQGFMAVNKPSPRVKPEDKVCLRCHKSLATVL